MEKLSPHASAVSALRVTPSGQAREYTAMDHPDEWRGIERLVRRCSKVGYLTTLDRQPHLYAVLDILDDTDDLVQHYAGSVNTTV